MAASLFGWLKQQYRTVGMIVAAWALSYTVESTRILIFGRTISWEVTLVWAPIHEDALKLGAALFLIAVFKASTGTPRATREALARSTQATKIMLVLCPLIAGFIVALLEPPHVNRFLGHTASVGLGFAVCLVAWRRMTSLSGLLLGLLVGASVHSFLNTAYYWPLEPRGSFQFAAALALLTLAVVVLSWAARREPASETSGEFFPQEA